MDLGCAYRNGDVHGGRVAYRVEVPALAGHRVADLEHVQRVPVRRGERNDGRGRVPEDAQLWDLGRDALRDRLRRGDDALAGLEIATARGAKGCQRSLARGMVWNLRVAHVLQGRPGSGDECTGSTCGMRVEYKPQNYRGRILPRTSDAGATVDTADPVGVHVVLEATQCRIAVHDDRVTLWRQSAQALNARV